MGMYTDLISGQKSNIGYMTKQLNTALQSSINSSGFKSLGSLKYIVSSLSTMVNEPVMLIDADKLLNTGFTGMLKNKIVLSQIVAMNVSSFFRNTAYAQSNNNEEEKGLMDLIDMVSKIIMLNVMKNTIPWAYVFRTNPQTAKLSFKKLQSVTSYGYGLFDVEQWGNDLVPYSFTGSTGILMPPWPLPDVGIIDPRLSVEYMKLKEFERFYKGKFKQMFLVLFGEAYLCYLESFDYGYDANDPRQIKYSFNVKVNPYVNFNILWGQVGDAYKYAKVQWEDVVNYSDEMTAYTTTEGTKSYTASTTGNYFDNWNMQSREQTGGITIGPKEDLGKWSPPEAASWSPKEQSYWNQQNRG